MSALPPKADIAEHDRHVRFVPKADISKGVPGGVNDVQLAGLWLPEILAGKFPKKPGMQASTIFRQAEGYRCDASLPGAEASP